MVLGSSAVVALLLLEPAAPMLETAMRGKSVFVIGAPAVLATAMVIETRRPDRGALNLDEFITARRIEIVPFDTVQLDIARWAFRRYGRGSGSKARLSFGDCCTYALARVRDESLLFVGEDFTYTDITSAA